MVIAVFGKGFNRGFDKAVSAVIAVYFNGFEQRVDIGKYIPVLLLLLNPQLRALKERYMRAEVFNNYRNGFSVIAVRRIPKQTGARISALFDKQFDFSL